MTKAEFVSNMRISHVEGTTVLDEVVEVIPLATNKSTKFHQDPKSIELGEAVESPLGDFVTAIAGRYHPNPFHSFELASHVRIEIAISNCDPGLSRLP